MAQRRPTRRTLAGLTIGLLVLALAACTSPSGDVCEDASDCEPGFVCVTTGGVVFGDKLCLLAERAPTGADAQMDVATDAPTDAGDDANDAADVSVDAPDAADSETTDTDAATCPEAGCDVDSDGDGVVDSEDGCPTRPNPDQRDRDGDGVQDACDSKLSVDYAGAVIPGPAQSCCGGNFPWQVTSGEVTGDGRDDLIITGHANGAFGLWVIDGATRPTGEVDSNTAIVRLSVPQEGTMGLKVGRLGDVNGDGVDDLLVGHPGAISDTGVPDAGAAYLFLGGASLRGDLTLQQADGEYFDWEGRVGFAVDIAPDVNGDGLDDMVIGEAHGGGAGAVDGRVHIIFGRAVPPERLRLIPQSGADVRLLGQNDELAGAAVAGVGDVNGDGIGDLIIGAPGASANSGMAYLVFGDDSWANTTLQLVDDALAFAPQDPHSSGSLGASVSRAGDVDGDGHADFLVGEPTAPGAGGVERAGAMYVVFGRANWTSEDDALPIAGAALRLEGSDFNGLVGFSVGAAGDLDRDGFDDILIGAPFASGGFGAVYVGFGSSEVINFEGQSAAIDLLGKGFIGRGIDSRLGGSVSSAGDVDGDGQLDVIISAIGHDATLDASGAAFLFYGP